jgi:hypothetical protein
MFWVTMASAGSIHKEIAMPVGKLITDTAFSATRLAESAIKETWSKLDAAAEKPKPSEYLGQKAVHAIQGIVNQTD